MSEVETSPLGALRDLQHPGDFDRTAVVRQTDAELHGPGVYHHGDAGRGPVRRRLGDGPQAHPLMSAFWDTGDSTWTLPECLLMTRMYGPAVCCKKIASSWRLCGLASMYPAFDWSLLCSGPSLISARVRSH